MKPFILAAALVAAMTPTLARADSSETYTAGYYLNACTKALRGSPSTPKDYFLTGKCMGAVEMLSGALACTGDANLAVVTKQVVRYIQEHPQVNGQEFAKVGAAALTERWPCQ